MNFNFNNNINNFLKIIVKNAQKQNIRVFFVGGIVRDNLLNLPTKDIDLIINSNAIEFSKALPDEIEIKSVHKDFCTAKVRYQNIDIDIASTRVEKYPHSGCLPIVEKIGVELLDDVKRRDFTVNSLYCELILENDTLKYKLIDLVDGVSDIKTKTLKVLHDKSYIDDPSRIIRGAGFKYRFGFDFSSCDKDLIKSYLSEIDYSNMSHDRLYKVFCSVFDNDFTKAVFREIIEKKYYKILFNRDLTVNFEKINEIIKTFSLSKSETIKFYMDIIENNPQELADAISCIDIYKTFIKFTPAKLAYYYYKTNDDNILFFNKIKNIKLNINGKDLIQLGYKQGKIIGEILDKLLDKKLENQAMFMDKDDEIDWVKSSFPI